MMLPPSPALSECDSLDGIDDLDAFLASQGQLSQWPTPPSLKKEAIVETTEIASDIGSDDGLPDFSHIASILSEAASVDIQSTPVDVNIIHDMLIRADLPLETIALALSILSGLQDCKSPTNAFTDTPPDLIVVGAFSLAVSYTNDRAPRPFWWSHFVCDCHWTGKRIDITVLKLLGALDFSLHRFTRDDLMKRAMTKLSGPTEAESIVFEDALEEQQPLKLLIDSNTAWKHGQYTPEATPPCPASPASESGFDTASFGLRMPLMRFIPLL